MLRILASKSRDNSRTPMQWDDSEHAGFTQGTPWIDVARNYRDVNAMTAFEDKGSVFYFYQSLVHLRKELPVITDGDYQDLMPDHPSVFAYARSNGSQTLICINNFYEERVEITLPSRYDMKQAKGVLGNYQTVEQLSLVQSSNQSLEPYESRVFIIESI